MTRRRVFCALALAAVVLSTVAAQAPDQAQQLAALRQALAQRTADLGTCNAQLGPLQQLSAQVIAGQVADVEATRTAAERAVVTAFEAANPGKTLDAKTGKVSDKAR